MRRRAACALAGALLVAGAGTGTTLAAWHAQQPVRLGSVQSASADLSVNGKSVADLGPLTGLHAGEATTVPVTVTDAAPPEAKDLVLAVYLDNATTSVPAIDDALTVDVRPTSGGCAPAASGVPLAQYRDTQPLATLAPQQSVSLCVTLGLPATAGPPPGGLSGTLSLTFRGQQVTS